MERTDDKAEGSRARLQLARITGGGNAAVVAAVVSNCQLVAGEQGRSPGMKNCVWLKPQLVAQVEFTEGPLRTPAALEVLRFQRGQNPHGIVREEAL